MNQTKLLELLIKHFNEEELKTVCFKMEPKIDYESLPAQGKSSKARELIEFCERRDRLHELIQLGKELRPTANWLKLKPSASKKPDFNQRPTTNSSTKQKFASALNIFLCHSSKNKQSVRKLYNALQKDGFQPWLDEMNLLPGQDWRSEVTRAVRSSDVVLICLSKEAISERGYIQKEIRIALEVADEHPMGSIFLIPIRLEDCLVPEKLNSLHYVDLYHEDGYEHLKKSLIQRFDDLYGNNTTQNLDLEEIKLLMKLVDWRQSREGYKAISSISNLKTKLIQMREQSENKQVQGNILETIELSLSLETVQENINYIRQYTYDAMSYEDAKKQKERTLAPLNDLYFKLHTLIYSN